MRKVIRLDEKEESKKPIELTHVHDPECGYKKLDKCFGNQINDNEDLYYIGNCQFDGDIFIGKLDGCIYLYKGYLNDGVY